MRKTYGIADTHIFHAKLATVYKDRPEGFEDLMATNWDRVVTSEDTVIHFGDVSLKNATEWIKARPGRKILVRGNHDRNHSCSWWMDHGFDFACDGFRWHNCWLTHEPALSLPEHCYLNIHGHLHNIWTGNPLDGARLERDRHLLSDDYRHHLKFHWQRLLAVEYTDYTPIELTEFIANPYKYQATGPRRADAQVEA